MKGFCLRAGLVYAAILLLGPVLGLMITHTSVEAGMGRIHRTAPPAQSGVTPDDRVQPIKDVAPAADDFCEALLTHRKMDVAAVASHIRESLRIGKLHGADRASNRSYQLREVIFEYHLLREVLFEVLETEGPLAKPARDIVLDSIEQAVNDAVVEFTEVLADIQQKFFDTLTHDLRTPVAVARMNAQVTLKRGDLAAPVKARRTISWSV